VNKHLYLCHPLVLSSPTLMMHGHMNLKYEGQILQFHGELCMVYVLVNSNGFFVEWFCRLFDGIFTFLATKVVSMYVQVMSEIGYCNGILHLL